MYCLTSEVKCGKSTDVHIPSLKPLASVFIISYFQAFNHYKLFPLLTHC